MSDVDAGSRAQFVSTDIHDIAKVAVVSCLMSDVDAGSRAQFVSIDIHDIAKVAVVGRSLV